MANAKRLLAVVLCVLMVVTGIPFVSLAAETGTLTISSEAAAQNIDIDDDVAFTYEVLINDEAFSGRAIGDDGNSYDVENGQVTLPYNVSATIADIPAGSSYSVKRLGYDNEKYALVDETSAQTGKVAENSYFCTVNDGEEETITAEEFAAGTNNGENLAYSVYKDAEGNSYTAEEVGKRGGYTGANDTTSGDYTYVLDTLESKEIKISVDYGKITTSSSGKLVKTWTAKAPASYTITCDGFDTVTGSVEGSGSMPGSEAGAKSSAKSNAGIDLAVALTEYAELVFNTTENESGKKTVYDSKGKLIVTKGAYCFGEFDFAENSTQEESVTVSAFTLAEDITSYSYRVEYGEADKTATFPVTLAPAPTGTFQINFALDDTVPAGYDKAAFEIKDSNGAVLTEGEDYKLEKSPYSLEDITKGVLKWGLTVYTFSELKAGDYTIAQKSTANGYKFDEEAVYSFNVARKDGKVTGENFDTCAINSKIPCLYNADKSINILVTKIKLYLYMNESFSLTFNVKDQKSEPVEGSQFMMIERDALIKLVGELASLGRENIGNLNINDLIATLGGLDFSNIDATTVIAILGAVLDVLPELPEGTTLTIPAILTASSDKDGVVNFKNASNMMNVLETINSIGEAADAEQLAETIKNLLGSTVPEEYLDTLVKLAKYIGILDVHTGIPAAYFVLINSAAPEGYERNAVMYTIKVGNDGNATTSAGILIPVIADVINERFDIDIYDILINEEEFNNASAAIKNTFGDFAEYMAIILDTVVDMVGDDLKGVVTKEDLINLRENIVNAYEEYDDLSAAIGEAVSDLNNRIKGDLDENWTYVNNRYFLDVPVTATTCEGDELVMSCKDKDGNIYDIVNGGTVLPYGTYKFALVSEGDYVLKEDESSSFTLVIDDHNAKYSVSYKYHVADITPATEPTCTEPGLTEGSHCSGCDAVLEAQKEIPANGHSVVTDEAVEATCTETGLTEGSHCDVCNVVLAEQEVVEAKGHHEVPIGEFVYPTCTENGITDGLMCDVCDEILEAREVLDNTGHFPAGDIDSAVEPTCTTDGKDPDFVCWRCGEKIAEGAVIPALGHVEVIDDAVSASCTETGLTEGSHCGVCKEVLVKQDVVEANGHNVIVDKAVAPTCQKTGLTEGSHCDVCDEILVAQVVLGIVDHDFVVTEVVASTCTSKGYTVYTCSMCGLTKIADYTDMLPHAYNTVNIAPTCEEDGEIADVCADCGDKINAEIVPATGHNYDSSEAVKDGEMFTCSNCGAQKFVPDCKYCRKVMETNNYLFRVIWMIIDIVYHALVSFRIIKR